MYSLDIGGGVVTGMAVFDTMRHIRPDVSTVCVGLAARYVSSLWGLFCVKLRAPVHKIISKTDVDCCA